ncbi:histidine--tRNA ligase [Desulfovibrio sp. OttesenSCG-928-I05]|nr:histidine--tRNA ligase [Desulfovibrio sp. OttesenSCG-928-I05]
MAGIQRIKGFADIFSPDSDVFSFLENTARRVYGSYGYEELRIPVLEFTELFTRGIGTETDVVQKEMFTFPDRKGRSMTMRPEATAGVMRAYIDASRHAKEPVSKFFSYGPMFRYERPQKGRMRQFHQINCECLGAQEPTADAEVILMLMLFLRELGIKNVTLELNSLGCRVCRPQYKETLHAFLAALDTEQLCEDCKRRMTTNPLRVLDCKVPGCKAATENAPTILEHNCPDCQAHFAVVRGILDASKVPYEINPRLVRGLDYYNRTTFEAVSHSIGAQGSIAGGGRYDGLVADLGGPDVPGVGYAAGMERLALALAAEENWRLEEQTDFYIAVLDESAMQQGLLLAQTLREAGRRGEVAFAAKSLKSQMRQASKIGARKCLLLGGNEMAMKVVAVKDMESGDQVSAPMANILDFV